MEREAFKKKFDAADTRFYKTLETSGMILRSLKF